MAVMVWCKSCKKVVWAYDEHLRVDLRGICNMFKLPCPKCGDVGNFDGWGSDHPISQLREMLLESEKQEVYDAWSAMRWIAKFYGVKWEPSGDNTWFHSRVNKDISTLIQYSSYGED